MATESIRQKWEAPTAIVTYLSGELNSFIDGTNYPGAKIDNVSDGENEMFIDLELYMNTQLLARDADARVEVYILYSLDDTNFDMGDESTDPRPESLLTIFSLDALTAARYRTVTHLPIAPFDFKLVLINETGQNWAALGNTFKYRLHSAEAQ